MNVNLGLVLGPGAGWLVVANLMGAALAIGFAKLSPLPAKPPEALPPAEPADPFVLALVTAGLILQYYMHLDRVWSEEEAH